MKAALFWRLPVRWQLRLVWAEVWLRAHTPHRHVWVGSREWSSATGWVQHDDYCAVYFKHRPPQRGRM